jgi:hypothetical protein
VCSQVRLASERAGTERALKRPVPVVDGCHVVALVSASRKALQAHVALEVLAFFVHPLNVPARAMMTPLTRPQGTYKTTHLLTWARLAKWRPQMWHSNWPFPVWESLRDPADASSTESPPTEGLSDPVRPRSRGVASEPAGSTPGGALQWLSDMGTVPPGREAPNGNDNEDGGSAPTNKLLAGSKANGGTVCGVMTGVGAHRGYAQLP